MRPTAILLAMGLLMARPSLGDALSYNEVKVLRAEGSDLMVEHHHDWSESTRRERSTMTSTDRNPFTAKYRYAYISARKKGSGKLLFRRPSPALSWIEVTSDSRYIVGLSNIMLDNLYQLVVYDRTGQLVAKHHVAPDVACLTPAEYRDLESRFSRELQALQGSVCARDGKVYVDFMRSIMPRRSGGLWQQLLAHGCPSPFTPNASESVTNWVDWYDSKNPDPEIVEKDGQPVALRVTDLKGKRITIPFACDAP